MSGIGCIKETCVNFKNGLCILKDPEKYGDACLDYEDIADALRLKIVFKKGSLSMRDD